MSTVFGFDADIYGILWFGHLSWRGPHKHVPDCQRIVEGKPWIRIPIGHAIDLFIGLALENRDLLCRRAPQRIEAESWHQSGFSQQVLLGNVEWELCQVQLTRQVLWVRRQSFDRSSTSYPHGGK